MTRSKSPETTIVMKEKTKDALEHLATYKSTDYRDHAQTAMPNPVAIALVSLLYNKDHMSPALVSIHLAHLRNHPSFSEFINEDELSNYENALKLVDAAIQTIEDDTYPTGDADDADDYIMRTFEVINGLAISNKDLAYIRNIRTSLEAYTVSGLETLQPSDITKSLGDDMVRVIYLGELMAKIPEYRKLSLSTRTSHAEVIEAVLSFKRLLANCEVVDVEGNSSWSFTGTEPKGVAYEPLVVEAC